MGLFGLTHMAPTTIQPGGQKAGCKRARILLRVGLPRVGTLGLLALTRRRAGGCPVVARGTSAMSLKGSRQKLGANPMRKGGRGEWPDWVLCLFSYAAWRNTFSRVLL
jgi:hypothetical protein